MVTFTFPIIQLELQFGMFSPKLSCMYISVAPSYFHDCVFVFVSCVSWLFIRTQICWLMAIPRKQNQENYFGKCWLKILWNFLYIVSTISCSTLLKPKSPVYIIQISKISLAAFQMKASVESGWMGEVVFVWSLQDPTDGLKLLKCQGCHKCSRNFPILSEPNCPRLIL